MLPSESRHGRYFCFCAIYRVRQHHNGIRCDTTALQNGSGDLSGLQAENAEVAHLVIDRIGDPRGEGNLWTEVLAIEAACFECPGLWDGVRNDDKIYRHQWIFYDEELRYVHEHSLPLVPSYP